MSSDPFGLGELLYGFDPVRSFAGGQAGMVAAVSATGYLMLIPETHDECSISTFCKNPLHPGPCKGWKKNLGIQAPGALHAIEQARKAKVAEKRKATAEAKSTASKNLTGRQLVSPLHAKKATIKNANILLGNDEAKAAGKADKVILNKAEIKKYSKIKAAQLNALRTKHGLEEDPGLEDRLADALAKDNVSGKDTLYRETLAVSADSMGAQLAQKHCAKGDGDCDGKPYEWLRDNLSAETETAMVTGDDTRLDKVLANYKAGTFKPPASVTDPEPEPTPAPAKKDVSHLVKGVEANLAKLEKFDKASTEEKAMDVLDGVTKKEFDGWPESAQADAEQIVMLNTTPQAEGLKKKLGFPSNAPAPATPAAEPDQASAASKVQDLFDGDAWSDWSKKDEQFKALKDIDPLEFDALPISTQVKVGKFLDKQGGVAAPTSIVGGEVASLKAKFGFGTQPPMPVVDPEPDVLQQLLDGVPESGAHLAKVKQAFGDDGDPDHEEAVQLVNAMSQDDWNALTTEERKTAMLHISDAASMSHPGSAEASAKIKMFQLHSKPAPPPAAPAMSPEMQLASDYATGEKSGTMTKKFLAYQVLEGEDFAKLPADTQKLIMADLAAAKDKFIAPNKKAAVQETIDHLSPFAGGGAGAGGSLGAPNPGAKSVAAKVSGAAAFASALDLLLGNVSSKDKAEAQGFMAKYLEQSHDNGTIDKVSRTLADGYANDALDKLSKMHQDPFGNSLLDPAAVAQLKPLLAVDLAKAIAGSDDPTPVYNAWEKAIYSGSAEDAEAFADVATGYTGGDATPGAAPPGATMQQKSDFKEALSLAWKDVGMGVTPANAPDSAMLEAAAETALAKGLGSPEHLDFSKKTGMVLGINALNNLFGQLDFTSEDVSKLPPATVMAANLQLNKEFEQTLKAGKHLGLDGTLLGDLKAIRTSVNEDGEKLAKSLGVGMGNETIIEYKRDLFTARLQQALAKYPAGAGGSTTAPNPAAAATAPPAPPKPTKATGGKVKLGTGASTTFTDTQQQIITGTIKANNVNLSSPSTDDWDVLVATAKAQAGKDGLPKTLTVMDVLNAADAGHAKNLGVANAGLLRKKVLDWLGTASGKAYAEANSTPKASLLQQMTGALSIKLKPGQKVQKVSGPGKYVAGYVPNAGTPNAGTWKKQTTTEALDYQSAYWAANPGTKWTPQQEESYAGYTLGSATINDYLRGETAAASTATKQAIINMQTGMVPLGEDTLLARGTGWEMFPEEYRSYEGVKKLIGKNVTDPAFLSTSVTGAGSQGFGTFQPVKVTIEAPKGTMGAMLEDLSHFKGGSEQEMLLAAGTVLRILSVEPDGSGVRVRARVVTPK